MKITAAMLLAILAAAACAAAAEPAGNGEPAAAPAVPATSLAPAALPASAASLAAASAAATAVEAAPGSVWGSAPNPLADKVYKQHDLITIVISEQSNAGTKLETTLDRKTNIDLEIAKAFSIKTTGSGGLTYEPLTALNKRPELDISGARKHEGTGEIKHNESFTARVTAEVIEVLPNGQLVLEARKRVKIGEETSNLVLTGRVRPEDVRSDNTVESDRVADPHIQYNPRGAVADANKRSWLTRAFDFINIF